MARSTRVRKAGFTRQRSADRRAVLQLSRPAAGRGDSGLRGRGPERVRVVYGPRGARGEARTGRPRSFAPVEAKREAGGNSPGPGKVRPGGDRALGLRLQ